MFTNYIKREHSDTIHRIITSPSANKHHSLNIPFLKLFEVDQELANLLLSQPETALEICDKQLNLVQHELQSEISEVSTQSTGAYSTIVESLGETVIHTRIYDLPYCPELHRTSFPQTHEEPPFLQLSGTVVRISAVKLLELKRDYNCVKCKNTTTVKADYNFYYDIIPPKRCRCNGTKFTLKDTLQADNCKDYQEIKLQEDINSLGPGRMARSLWVTLEDDLADRCKPGDSVTICGMLKRRWRSLIPDKHIDVSLVLKANHISVNNDTSPTVSMSSEMELEFSEFWTKHRSNELVGRDFILRSLCPQIYGLYSVKLAIALVLAGGAMFNTSEANENAPRTRTEPHILLVGDPGTGKSQLLRQAAKIIPRSVMTTGIGSTSAGLTVTSIMENGEWQLEAGALVLADGGICCIDEFNSMKEHDRVSIHEAMEQQTISVAKAGIVCKLNTRCSILAAANSKGPLDTSQPLSINVAMGGPLLSRFDLILLLKDRIDPEWDKQVVDHIADENKPPLTWSLEMLRRYFLRIKSLNPRLTPQTRSILSAYYQYQRRLKDRNQARTTVRLLDSLIRLSQAHAKLICHEMVHIVDAVMAISLISSSMDANADADFTAKVLAPFPIDPYEQYHQCAADIFEKINMNFDECLSEERKLLNGLNVQTTNINFPQTVPLDSNEFDNQIIKGESESKENATGLTQINCQMNNESIDLPLIEIDCSDSDVLTSESVLKHTGRGIEYTEVNLENIVENTPNNNAFCDSVNGNDCVISESDIADSGTSVSNIPSRESDFGRLNSLKKKFGFLAHNTNDTNDATNSKSHRIESNTQSQKVVNVVSRGCESIFDDKDLGDFNFDL